MVCFAQGVESLPLPALPNEKLLMQKLLPSFNVLSNIGRRQDHGAPLYAVTGIQRTAAEGFLQVPASPAALRDTRLSLGCHQPGCLRPCLQSLETRDPSQ